jgi:hypothetical protein
MTNAGYGGFSIFIDIRGFVAAMVQRVWEFSSSTKAPDTYLESFKVDSWAEHGTPLSCLMRISVILNILETSRLIRLARRGTVVVGS